MKAKKMSRVMKSSGKSASTTGRSRARMKRNLKASQMNDFVSGRTSERKADTVIFWRILSFSTVIIAQKVCALWKLKSRLQLIELSRHLILRYSVIFRLNDTNDLSIHSSISRLGRTVYRPMKKIVYQYLKKFRDSSYFFVILAIYLITLHYNVNQINFGANDRLKLHYFLFKCFS